MPPFLIALAVVIGGVWLIRKYAKLSPAAVPGFTQKIAGFVIMAFAGLLLFRGDINAALALGVFGMGLYGKSTLFPNGMNFRPQQQAEQQSAPPPMRGRASMSRAEALQVLGLKTGASADDVKQAHKRLIKDFHPDKGGSDYLAAKINEAKDILLGA